ncbi:Derlin, partial [Caligus rogercresseyi]
SVVQEPSLFTRYWFGLTLGFTLLGRFGVLSPKWLILLWDSVFHDFQLWRPLSALFFYPLSPQSGFHFLINLYYLYNYSLRLETGTFEGRPGDYLFMLLFNWAAIVAIGLFMEIYVLMDPMVLSVLYVWCQLNKDTVITFWFGTQFKAMYLPW